MKKAGMDYIAELRDLCENPLEQWRATHATFEEYCRERLGYGERRVRQIVSADTTRNLLLLAAESESDLQPAIKEMNEDAIRPLNGLPKADALKVLREAIKLPSKQARKQITLAKIKLAKKVLEPAPTIDADTHEVQACCPHCQRPL